MFGVHWKSSALPTGASKKRFPEAFPPGTSESTVVLEPQLNDSLWDCPLASTTAISDIGSIHGLLSPFMSETLSWTHSFPAAGVRNWFPVETPRLKLVTV